MTKLQSNIPICVTERISESSQHAAFTDLIVYRDRILCCYRLASSHMSEDGCIAIYSRKLNERQGITYIIELPNSDLRDPKFLVDSSNVLWVSCYPRILTDTPTQRQMYAWSSNDGESWSSQPVKFGPNNWWLWKLYWLHDRAYSLGYNRAQERLDFFSGHPETGMDLIQEGALSKQHHNLGYPNESALASDENNTLFALTRRDADTYSAQFGICMPPYKSWTWFDLGAYVGGPALLHWRKNWFIVAGRSPHLDTMVTKLWLLDAHTFKLHEIATLPSAGDTSYPGFALEKSSDTLYISYYSEHLHDQCSVYLTSINNISEKIDYEITIARERNPFATEN